MFSFKNNRRSSTAGQQSPYHKRIAELFITSTNYKQKLNKQISTKFQHSDTMLFSNKFHIPLKRRVYLQILHNAQCNHTNFSFTSNNSARHRTWYSDKKLQLTFIQGVPNTMRDDKWQIHDRHSWLPLLSGLWHLKETTYTNTAASRAYHSDLLILLRSHPHLLANLARICCYHSSSGLTQD